VSALPGAIFNKIVAAFPTAKKGPGAYVDVDCSVADLKGSIDFKFGNTVIKVPYADFIWHNDDRCVLGVFQDDEFPVLGDTFLRAAYVVYDWDNRNVWLANNEDCGTNLVTIGSGPNAVPDLVGECGSGNTQTSEVPTSTESASESVTESVSSAETTSESVTESISSAETTSGDVTGSSDSSRPYPTATRYTNNTVITTKTASSDGGSTGGSGQTYVLPTTAVPSTTITSTVTTSTVYTITACPPSVTNCPIGQVTTETRTHLTTYCPGSDATASGHAAPAPTKGPVRTVVTSTRLHTVTDCPGSGPCVEGGVVSTEIVYNTQLMHPEQPTGIYTIPQAIHCGAGNFGCKEATTFGYHTFTMTSVVEAPKPTPVPGFCKNCGPPSPSKHHGNGTYHGGYTITSTDTIHAEPTKDNASPGYPQPTPGSPKPAAHSGNPLEELHSYIPTNVYAQIPSNTVATVIKTPGVTPSEPTGTSPVVINGASAWNIPVLAAAVVGALVVAL
jgi:hypothetical protein